MNDDALPTTRPAENIARQGLASESSEKNSTFHQDSIRSTNCESAEQQEQPLNWTGKAATDDASRNKLHSPVDDDYTSARSSSEYVDEIESLQIAERKPTAAAATATAVTKCRQLASLPKPVVITAATAEEGGIIGKEVTGATSPVLLHQRPHTPPTPAPGQQQPPIERTETACELEEESDAVLRMLHDLEDGETSKSYHPHETPAAATPPSLSCDTESSEEDRASGRSAESTGFTKDDDNFQRIHSDCLETMRQAFMAHRRPGSFNDSHDNVHKDEDVEYRAAARSSEFEHPIEDPIDLDMFRDNSIITHPINPKHVVANNLGPREQEEADEPVREGMRNLFDNRFMKAKGIFQSKASFEPFYALGLGAMAFIKAMMTRQEPDVITAMDALAASYAIASAQIDNAMYRRPLKVTLSQYLPALWSGNKFGLPASPAPARESGPLDPMRKDPIFLPNGILRAHVIKAESCLLMGVLQLAQETVVSYLKCGLNLRRAYKSYSIVWREYKRMGQKYTKYMDRDTVSAIQFGIGAVHLMLASMPLKIHKVFTTLGWQGDKQLGFALLKLCIEGRGIRAPLASLTLLSYYSVLPSFAPQIYTKELMGPAIECLLDAQKHHPSSCFFLYFAARIARVARNLPLSTQSFAFAAESSRGEWAEVAMRSIVDYETGFNLALQLDWEGAAKYFEQLGHDQHYWSRSFIRYFEGACLGMLGQRTDCILKMAEVAQMAKEDVDRRRQQHQHQHRQQHPQQHQQRKLGVSSFIDTYVQKKVALYQISGYQEIELCLPALEILLVWNAFDQMQDDALKKCLVSVQRTLKLVYEREKNEYAIRMRELVPSTKPPDYYNYRAVLLLIKASLMNALGQYSDSIAHLNWIIDHQDLLTAEAWLLPFTYWEAGVTSWGMGNIKKSRSLWQHALKFSKYDFEYRMAVRLSLALAKCDELGVQSCESITTGYDDDGPSTHTRKRMPIIHR